MASTKALAKNEERFRNVNERIEEISAAVPREQPLLEFLCECDRFGCEEKIRMAGAEHEEVRAESTYSSSYLDMKIPALSGSSPRPTAMSSSESRAAQQQTPTGRGGRGILAGAFLPPLVHRQGAAAPRPPLCPRGPSSGNSG
jgi:hypothetical protein